MVTRDYDDHTTPLSYVKRLGKYISDPSTIRVRVLEYYGRCPSMETIKQNIVKRERFQYDVEPEAENSFDALQLVEVATPAGIVSDIARHFGLTYSDLVGPNRLRRIAYARFLAATILRDRGNSESKIGECLGGRDRTTVRNAIASFSETIKRDDKMREAYQPCRTVYVK